MNKTWKWILLSLAVVVVLALILRATTGRADDTKVTVEAAQRRTIVETVSASGKLYPENEIRITPAVAGEVSELNVQEGQHVEKGQTLAFIKGDRTTAPPRVSLPANIPPGFESLVQGMQQPRVSSPSSASIKAPMSGTVLDLSVKKGERVSGGELMRIADLSTLEVRVNVNENNIIKIAVGDSADVEIEAYNKRKFKGVVTTITNGGNKRDAQSFLPGADVTAYEVHVRLLPSSYADLYDSSKHNIPFRPGMTAKTEIKTARHENVLSVPVGAVVSRPKGSDENSEPSKKTTDEKDAEESTADEELEEVVFVLKADNTVEKRTVSTGLQDMTYFEISKGLQEGEKVITAPYGAVSKTLRNGKKVSVVSRDKLFETK